MAGAVSLRCAARARSTKTATVAANSAAPTAMSVISHPAMPVVTTAWATVGCGWDTAGCVRARDGV